ncbi:hypothetical protein AKJ09_10083 [Labilithrix luteola]|uniref:Lipoprotein n=2 Tax=Labilithrix luteola TaxID=1391654 RepID=A0A0K1QDB0_9BACT|nr:hypothetical protein AKJ09_10083 [Labilithrix luteola]
MRPRLLNVFATLALGCFGAACSNSSDSGPAPAPTAPVVEQPAPTPTTPTGRQLIDSAGPTSPVNLIIDPNFALATGSPSYGAFLAVSESGGLITLDTTADSRSPAGFAGNVAIVKAPNATDKRSTGVLLLASFQGGEGPFDAQVWVSKTDLAGNPADVTIDAKGITASITNGTLDGQAYDLTPVDDERHVAGGKTWVLLRTKVTDPLPYGGYFLVNTGTGGGQFLVARPEIVPQSLAAGVATRSLDVKAVRAPRPLTDAERLAMKRYRAIPQRFVPAGAAAGARPKVPARSAF